MPGTTIRTASAVSGPWHRMPDGSYYRLERGALLCCPADAAGNMLTADACECEGDSDASRAECQRYADALELLASAPAWSAPRAAAAPNDPAPGLRSQAFRDAIEAFDLAAARLLEAWEREPAGDVDASGYPAYLPSFDQFAADVSAWRHAELAADLEHRARD